MPATRAPLPVPAAATAAVALGLFVVFAARLAVVAGGQALVVRLPWMPTLGAHLSFHLDGLSLLFALLVTGIGAIVVVHAGAYLAGEARLGQFYAFLLLFAAAMLGLVLADNVILLFVCWELTSLIVVGLLAADVIQTAEPVLLDAAIVLALIGFVSTVAFARYLERRTRR